MKKIIITPLFFLSLALAAMEDTKTKLEIEDTKPKGKPEEIKYTVEATPDVQPTRIRGVRAKSLGKRAPKPRDVDPNSPMNPGERLTAIKRELAKGPRKANLDDIELLKAGLAPELLSGDLHSEIRRVRRMQQGYKKNKRPVPVSAVPTAPVISEVPDKPIFVKPEVNTFKDLQLSMKVDNEKQALQEFKQFIKSDRNFSLGLLVNQTENTLNAINAQLKDYSLAPDISDKTTWFRRNLLQELMEQFVALSTNEFNVLAQSVGKLEYDMLYNLILRYAKAYSHLFSVAELLQVTDEWLLVVNEDAISAINSQDSFQAPPQAVVELKESQRGFPLDMSKLDTYEKLKEHMKTTVKTLGEKHKVNVSDVENRHMFGQSLLRYFDYLKDVAKELQVRKF